MQTIGSQMVVFIFILPYSLSLNDPDYFLFAIIISKA